MASDNIQILGAVPPQYTDVLSDDALEFVAELHRNFETTRRRLMQARVRRQAEIDGGATPDFLAETRSVREGDWRVQPAPADLTNRRVEITGPSSNRRMVINALNCGAQTNVRDAYRRIISDEAADGRQYRLNENIATLCVRPRGLHLMERHVLVDGEPVAGSFFDFGLTVFHNHVAQQSHGTGPYYYLPKLQSYLEARLWNDVFRYAEERLGIPTGTISPTVLIEHILAAFEMEEILYELRERPAGLNLGRWDYIFSVIKVFNGRSDMVFPDRAQVTMATHFLTSAAHLLVNTCHRRGAHALGGMSAFIPRRDDAAANEAAFAQVKSDKQREADQGFDGAWIAHPGLVEPVLDVFQSAFTTDNQLSVIPEVRIAPDDLLAVPEGQITEAGLRNNVSVALQYIDAWTRGNGAVAIYGLMEDAATAEISRSQLWQWLQHGAALDDGRPITTQLYRQVRAQEAAALVEQRGQDNPGALDKAVELLDEIVLSDQFVEFLTLPGYRYLD
ncbi:Malate synthase [Geodia barretti]|uniref:malate synthase n=1 Tax=Geodia barretti TaxID=519541 RepID=A0AA35TSC7_GEOBA|nr:Malate synthase [Geodia barretti]